MASSPIFLALCLTLLITLSQTQPQPQHDFQFQYNDFHNSTLELFQATVIPSGALKLTNKTQNEIGQAFHPNPVPLFNTTSNASSFSTYFVFQISPFSSNNAGYGFSFVLSPNPMFDNPSPGQLLGVFNPNNERNPSNHIFMVEFDTVTGYNETTEGVGEHVGVNINTLDSVADQPAYYRPTQRTTETVDISSDAPFQAWIDYDASTQHVNVTISPIDIPRPEWPLISTNLSNPSSVFLQNMYAGFTAATGNGNFSSHYILGWSFRLNGPASPLNLSRLPDVPEDHTNTPSPISSSSNNRLRIALIATFSVILFLLLAALTSTFLYRRAMNFEVLEDWELDSPHRFRHRDLYKATKGFNETEKIGSGGFGSVYKGVLPSTGVEVAVKRIKSNNQLQGMREFAAEIESLGRLRHKNLVNLQGWCKYKNDLLLVYDYVPNGSLDSLIFMRRIKKVLSWEHRYNILKGVANGLLYLHEEWEQVVIHRDVKSSNVLIDGDMNPRLGDFGLARSYDHAKNSHTTGVVGTIGYIAPELTRTGKASKCTDVFAYGILLLEVACGRGPVVYEADRNVILVDWVAECMQSGDVFGAVDGRLGSDFDVGEMELVLGLGLLCSHPMPECRPSMREVVKYLNRDETLPLFDKLSEAGPRRVDEMTSRFLAMALVTDSVGTDTSTSTDTNNRVSFRTGSAGPMSNASIDSGR